MSLERRRQLVEPHRLDLSIVRQCALMAFSRSGFYHRPIGETAEDLALMRIIDTQFLEMPWYGSRQMARHLQRDGHAVGRKRMRWPMATMGLVPVHQRPRTMMSNPEHRVFPYLLRDLVIDRPNQTLVRRHHLHSNAPRLLLPGRGDESGHPQGTGVAGVEH